MSECRDIFKDGPSPELQAEWDRLDALEAEFWDADREKQFEMLREHRELIEIVTCFDCKQIFGSGLSVDCGGED